MALPAFYPNQSEDYRLVYGYVQEYCTFFLPLINYYTLDTETSEIDSLHNEILTSSKSFSDEISVRAFFEPTDTEQNLEMKGTDFTDTFEVHISLPSAVDAEIATIDANYRMATLSINNGDAMMANDADHLYVIENVIDGSPWGQDGFSMMWITASVKIKRGDISTGEIVYNPDVS